MMTDRWIIILSPACMYCEWGATLTLVIKPPVFRVSPLFLPSL